MTEGRLLHLLPAAEWDAFAASGAEAYEPASLATEGFVHCSGSDASMLRVAGAFYRDLPGEVVVLGLDPARLRAEVRWEAPPGGDPFASERFPHVYGPLDAAAVVEVRRFERDAAGGYVGIVART